MQNHQTGFPGLEFIKEIDKLKSILRRTSLHDGSRRENSAEHSWHLAMSVLTLQHLADEPFHLERAMKMAMVHDVVEIDAGDTFVYDAHLMQEKAEKEKRAAERLFALVPHIGDELKNLWFAYEEQNCPESRFVGALDRFLPILANVETHGRAWGEHKVPLEKILERNGPTIARGSQKLWAYTKARIEDCYHKTPWI